MPWVHHQRLTVHLGCSKWPIFYHIFSLEIASLTSLRVGGSWADCEHLWGGFEFSFGEHGPCPFSTVSELYMPGIDASPTHHPVEPISMLLGFLLLMWDEVQLYSWAVANGLLNCFEHFTFEDFPPCYRIHQVIKIALINLQTHSSLILSQVKQPELVTERRGGFDVNPEGSRR